MSDAPERLSPELEAFLTPERRRPDPPIATQNEVFSRLGASLGWFGGPGSGSGGSEPGGHPGAGGGAVAHGVGHLAAGSVMKTIATLVVGGLIGSGVHEAYDRATDRRAERSRVAIVAPPTPTPTPAPAVAPAVEPAAAQAVVKDTRTSSPPPRLEHVARTEGRERDRNLAAERALIEQARTALGREQGAAALAVLERHSHDFPQGALEEERESLQVRALVDVERFDQARKAAARFHRRFPRSIFGAVVDEALTSIP